MNLGSGNTWVRSIIEAGTSIFTGSVYGDVKLRKQGFQGELMDSFASPYPRTIVVKTHSDIRVPLEGVRKVTAALYILRSPFDVALSQFNLEETKSHTAQASLHSLKTEFPRYFSEALHMWLYSVKTWLPEVYWEREDWPKMHSDTDVTTYLFHKDVFHKVHPKKKNADIPIFIIFYEDLTRNFDLTTKSMFDFIESRVGKGIIDHAHECAVLKHISLQEKSVKRFPKNSYNPFTDPELPFAQGQLKNICKLLKNFWYEDKWGQCEIGLRQAERGIKPIHLEVPKNPCGI